MGLLLSFAELHWFGLRTLERWMVSCCDVVQKSADEGGGPWALLGYCHVALALPQPHAELEGILSIAAMWCIQEMLSG